MASLSASALRTLFSTLGLVMLATLIYTLAIDGLPFRKELLTPWMAATLIDFYIDVVPLVAWVFYKEPNWISAVVWMVLLVCFGSITTCAFIVVQLLKFSSQDHLHDPMYYLLMRNSSKDDFERKGILSSVVAARIVFGALGCVMLGTLIYTIVTDGSPFVRENFTLWMITTLIDFYINIAAFSVWVAYKESSWISALPWIVMLICLGSIATCTYIVFQLFLLSSQDPLYLVLLNNRSRNGFKMLTISPESS